MAPDNLVPFRWPRAWDEASLLSLLARSPINCLIVEAGVGPIAEAARAAGKTLLETNSPAAAPLLKINWGTAGSFQLPSFSWYAALEFKS